MISRELHSQLGSYGVPKKKNNVEIKGGKSKYQQTKHNNTGNNDIMKQTEATLLEVEKIQKYEFYHNQIQQDMEMKMKVTEEGDDNT